MRILLYRFFLNKTEQLSLLHSDKSKIDILKQVLSGTYHFRHRRSDLGYLCVRQEGSYIYARFGRRSTQPRTLSPEERFEIEREETWPNCRVFIRIDDDPNRGQVIGVEDVRMVFSNPLSPLRALADKINNILKDEGYFLSVHTLPEETDFWKYVEANTGKITELAFSFAAPNLLNVENALNDDLKRLQEEYNITETKIALCNPTGSLKVEKSSKLVTDGVEYITKGGGEYRLKARGHIHSSNSKSKTKTLDIEIDLKTADRETFMKTLKELTEL